ncbi:MAG TPA: tRNA pseudouridine(38-40) synthase TruA [Gemmatimonadaceae bacterium]|nr:tRNA pseudouridine(38-40) synthase TruA [Gemmatimonadaceae bacterium]
MPERVIQLVVQYDGTDFSGWQVQPGARTVQGVLEEAVARLAGGPARVTGAGRTDAGVHARGQAAGVRVALHWTPDRLRRAMNSQLPNDVWIADAHEMAPTFHARYSATARRYRYAIGLGVDRHSPFTRRFHWPWDGTAPDPDALAWCAARATGDHAFHAFAVRGTAPADDDHRCHVQSCEWTVAGDAMHMVIEANRFLHHMVRFLVGTMMDVASGRRPRADFDALLGAPANDGVSPPAPASGLTLESVTYPAHLYVKA